MPRRLGGAGVAVIFGLAIVLGPVAAFAHNPANWFDARWFTESLIGPPSPVEYVFSASTSTSNQSAVRARTNEAAATWSNRAGGTLTFQSDGTSSQEHTVDACGGPAQPNSIHRATIDGPGGWLMVTFACYTTIAGQSHMLRFTISYDLEEEWYVTAGGSPDPAEVDFRGVMTHEFGHAAGGWLDGTHWDQGPNAQAHLCPFDSGRHTMCHSIPAGVTWWRSLARHDGHTFDNQY